MVFCGVLMTIIVFWNQWLNHNPIIIYQNLTQSQSNSFQTIVCTNLIQKWIKVTYLFSGQGDKVTIVKLLFLFTFMIARQLLYFFRIAVVALIRFNDVVSCHETCAKDWLKPTVNVLGQYVLSNPYVVIHSVSPR